MEIVSDVNSLDFRKLSKEDLKPRSHTQRLLSTHFEEKFDTMEAAMKDWLPILRKLALYYEGYQMPMGTSGDIMQHFLAKHHIEPLDQPRKDKSDFIFFPDNIIYPAVNGITAEYLNSKKKIYASANGVEQYTNIAATYQQLLDYFQYNIAGIDEDDQENLWTDYIVPAMESCILFGLSWLQLRHNPYRGLKFGGLIECEMIEPHELLFDNLSTKKYLKDSDMFVRKKAVEINQARRTLSKRYGIDPKSIEPDSDGSMHNSLLTYRRKYQEKDEFVTLYELEHRQWYCDEKSMDEILGMRDVPPEIRAELPKHYEDNLYYFNGLYTQDLGLIAHAENKINRFSYVAVSDQRSRITLNPKSRAEHWLVLQDINNVAKTIALDKVRMQSVVRLFVTQKLIKEFGPTVVERFMRIGGALEVDGDELDKQVREFKLEGLSQTEAEFVNLAENKLKEATTRNRTNEGDYPEERLSTKSIQLIRNQARKQLSPLDVNFQWAAEQINQLIYKNIATHYHDQQILEMTGENPNNPKHVPINAILTMQEYGELVARNGSTFEEFETKNQVKFLHNQIPEVPGVVSPAGIFNSAAVMVNPIREDDKIRVKVSVEFAPDVRQAERLDAYMWMFEQPEIRFAVFDYILDALDLETEKEKIKKKIEEQSPAWQLVDMIQSLGPQAVELGKQFFAQLQSGAQQNAPGGGQSGGQAPPTQPKPGAEGVQ